jgi:hypothetical protein
VGANIVGVLIEDELSAILRVLESVRRHQYIANFDVRLEVFGLEINRAVELLEGFVQGSALQVAVSQSFMRRGKLWINLNSVLILKTCLGILAGIEIFIPTIEVFLLPDIWVA